MIHALSVDGSPLRYEPSMISTSSVDGSALDHEPSVISTPSVDGSPPNTRTFHDLCPQRGRFDPWYLNHPRYRLPAWKVRPLVFEPSVIQALSVDGSALDSEPSVISASNVEGSPPDARTIRDSGPQHGRFRFGPRTVRDIDSQRGRFAPWYPNHPRFRPSAWTVPLWTPNRP